MWIMEYSLAFRRDYKRANGMPRYRDDIDALLSALLELLMHDRKGRMTEGWGICSSLPSYRNPQTPTVFCFSKSIAEAEAGQI